MKPLLKFDEAAHPLYVNVYNEIELNMSPGGLYDNATDHASKLMENIARVAGILHVINNEQGDISYNTLDNAIHICIFFSKEYTRVFDNKPQHVVNAMVLNDWLTTHFRLRDKRFTTKRCIQQFANAQLRKPSQLRDALEFLEYSGAIKTSLDEKKTIWIDTLPDQPDIV